MSSNQKEATCYDCAFSVHGESSIPHVDIFQLLFCFSDAGILFRLVWPFGVKKKDNVGTVLGFTCQKNLHLFGLPRSPEGESNSSMTRH